MVDRIGVAPSDIVPYGYSRDLEWSQVLTMAHTSHGTRTLHEALMVDSSRPRYILRVTGGTSPI